MSDDKRQDPLDDLFEPFDLEATENEQQQRHEPRTIPVSSDEPRPEPPPAPTVTDSSVLCGACGTANHPANRHCDACGARLVRSQMPVAPQPMLRTTAGARALIVLAGVVLAVALLALLIQMVGSEETAAPPTTAPTQTTVGNVQALQPLRVQCTSELDGFPCEALIDGNPETSWNATEGGVGTEITFLFQPPVQITEMWLDNLEDEGRFLRNARINGIEVALDDRAQLHITNLADSQETQEVRLNSMRTSRVTITITSAYPGISYEGQEPFNELALQSITFWGRPTPGE